MAKCPRCATRKGKRYCPALETSICPQCCATERLQTIACPKDCPHLSSEIYQHKKRRERAFSRGKDFVETNNRLFPSQEPRQFAFNLQADIFFFLRQHGSVDDVDDEVIATVLDNLKSAQGTIVLFRGAPHPLEQFLVERLEDEVRYPLGPSFDKEHRVRAIKTLAAHARSLAANGNRRFLAMLDDFFGALDFEADLDYSPYDARTRAGAAEKRSPGGLILPG